MHIKSPRQKARVVTRRSSRKSHLVWLETTGNRNFWNYIDHKLPQTLPSPNGGAGPILVSRLRIAQSTYSQTKPQRCDVQPAVTRIK